MSNWKKYHELNRSWFKKATDKILGILGNNSAIFRVQNALVIDAKELEIRNQVQQIYNTPLDIKMFDGSWFGRWKVDTVLPHRRESNDGIVVIFRSDKWVIIQPLSKKIWINNGVSVAEFINQCGFDLIIGDAPELNVLK